MFPPNFSLYYEHRRPGIFPKIAASIPGCGVKTYFTESTLRLKLQWNRCENVKQSGIRLQRLIEELLSLTEVSETSSNYNMSWADLQAIIKKSIQLHTIANNNISITFEEASSPVYLYFDKVPQTFGLYKNTFLWSFI